MDGCHVSREATLCQVVEWVELTHIPCSPSYSVELGLRNGWALARKHGISVLAFIKLHPDAIARSSHQGARGRGRLLLRHQAYVGAAARSGPLGCMVAVDFLFQPP
ncbi:hypothetical protein PIB30_062982 [Stylosanthes scabra]|uniref:Uncharacterized protein n=1 Tax=Stylosanthes scabra TaxID=79078 RepID=A0ABU6ZK00_9FABA|nr:hypothetical protein [Stylosanthes scabra]